MSVAFIPGISINKKDPHTFIQVFVSSEHELKTEYHRFKSDEFIYSHDQFSIQIDGQSFSANNLEVNLEKNGLNVRGKLSLEQHTPIKKNIYQPNIMGPFAYLSFMECYHGVLSMQSIIKGSLEVNGQTVDFTGGKAYLEKDWGKSFPKAYVWLQSNHFTNKKTSLMFSYAIIPFKVLSFKGLIVNLVYNEKEYRFSSYNLSKVIKKEIEGNSALFVLKKGKYQLHIKATKDKEIELKSPSFGQMNQTIKEGLSGYIEVKLYEKDVLIYEDTGYNAGIEIMMK